MDPWERAASAAEQAGVAVRLLETLEEARAAVDVSRATWGDTNVVPPEVFRAFQESGNLLQGAFRDDRLIGIAVGWFGRDEDGWHLHSHQLAVLPDVRSTGIGFALKMAQRAATLDAGVSRVRWTFDPMQSRNAHFNLAKLGARADAFHRDFYGDMPDELNAGDRSDRLVVRWDVQPEPTGADADASDGHIPIPDDFAALKSADPEEAARLREDVAVELERVFAEGSEITGFTRGVGYDYGPRGSM